MTLTAYRKFGIRVMPQNLVSTRFEKAASTYDRHAWLQKEIGQRLVEKLAILKHPATRVLDIGQGTGLLYQLLPEPKPSVFGIDLSHGMCKLAQDKFAPKSWFKFKHKHHPKFIQADAHQLPFLPESFELMISNCVFQWCQDLPRLFKDCHRALTLNGSLFFSTFGPDSLQELRFCTQQISEKPHVHAFLDMHEIGDMLLATPFTDPIVDMEKIVTYYDSVESLLTDLKKIGATNQHAERPKGLTGKSWLAALKQEYEKLRTPEGLPVTWEIVYGHAIKTKPLPQTWQNPEGKIFTSVRRS